MHRAFTASLLAATVVATSLASTAGADASDRWRHRDRDDTGAIVAAGVLGLAAGAIIAGAANEPVRRVYEDPYDNEPVYDDGPRYVVREYRRPIVVREYERPVRHAYRAEPWTPAWFDYCESRYRSFNPDSGTFVGYDGREHFCLAN